MRVTSFRRPPRSRQDHDGNQPTTSSSSCKSFFATRWRDHPEFRNCDATFLQQNYILIFLFHHLSQRASRKNHEEWLDELIYSRASRCRCDLERDTGKSTNTQSSEGTYHFSACSANHNIFFLPHARGGGKTTRERATRTYSYTVHAKAGSTSMSY